MLRILLFFTVITLTLNSNCQNTGYIFPSQSHTNTSQDTLIYLTKQKVDTLLKYKTKYEYCNQRVTLMDQDKQINKEWQALCDSALTLKRLEAEYWHMQLQKNDAELLDQKKANLYLKEENDKVRRSRIYYFAAGIVSASIFYIAVK